MISRKVVLWASIFTALVVLCTAAFAFMTNREPDDMTIRKIAYDALSERIRDVVIDWEQAKIVEFSYYTEYKSGFYNEDNPEQGGIDLTGRTVYEVYFKIQDGFNDRATIVIDKKTMVPYGMHFFE